MFNGSRFFNLARKWKKEGKDSTYFFILEAVMTHYFGSIAGYRNKSQLVINGAYSYDEIDFILSSVGYYNYSILPNDPVVGKTTVIFRNSL